MCWLQENGALDLQWLCKPSSRGSGEMWLVPSWRNPSTITSFSLRPRITYLLEMISQRVGPSLNYTNRCLLSLHGRKQSLPFPKEAGKIPFSYDTDGSSGCSALYLVLCSRSILYYLWTLSIHGVWVFCDTALEEYWFYSSLWKVAFLLYFGGEKSQVKVATSNSSYATHVHGDLYRIWPCCTSWINSFLSMWKDCRGKTQRHVWTNTRSHCFVAVSL